MLHMDQSLQDRREYQRARIEIQVHIWNDGVNVTGFVMDLSGGGMSVLTPSVLPSPAEVQVSFDIPSSLTVKCLARVMWSSETRRAGLKFMNLSEADRAGLEKWASGQDVGSVPAKGVI